MACDLVVSLPQVLAAAFPDIDEQIDARPANFELGEYNPLFRNNFHRLEHFLYRSAGIPGARRPGSRPGCCET